MSTEVIVLDNTAIVTTEIDYYSPIISGAQGPEGQQGPQGLPGATGPQGIPGTGNLTSISALTDVAIQTLTDGAILVYDAESVIWKPTTVLQKQAIECGQY